MAKRSTVEASSDMMSLPECASYLHLSENTILKLAANNKLPGVLVEKRWLFKRELVDEWLREQLDSTDDGIEDIPDGMSVPLGDLLLPEGVMDLESVDALGIIEELAARAYNLKWLSDKPWFVGAVVERETLASTAMEGGVAFLHTRQREANKIARPFVIAGRSYSGVDFGAPDGKPTFIFFMLGLKYDKLHLPILGRLARAMRNPVTINKLRAQPSPAKMRALLLKADAGMLSTTRPVPVHYEQIKPKLDRQMRLRTIMRLNSMRKQETKKVEGGEKKARKSAKADAATTAPAKAGKGSKADEGARPKSAQKKPPSGVTKR